MIARFTQEDEYWGDGLNLYAYCANNPVVYYDPSGYSSEMKSQPYGESSNASKSYQTYTKTNPQTGEVYSGRTSGTGSPLENIANRDAKHHMNENGFGPAELDRSSTNKEAIRGREQQLIDKYGGAKSQKGSPGNSINGISEKNPKRQKYFDEAKKEFGEDD